ncbi:MAG TPA: regulatory protein RecX [Xanthomonadales bacterium]|nr:regulatory protein RecX [Xanthomonadales bacterium]
MSEQTVSLNDLRAYAMRLLAKREYAVNELHGRLCTKWRGTDGIGDLAGELVSELVDEGALSDQRYVAAFVRSRQQRNQGPVKIRAELRQRRLSDALVETSMEQDDEFWTNLALGWLSRQHHGPLEFEDRTKYYRRLVNRGFSHNQAMSALELYSKA